MSALELFMLEAPLRAHTRAVSVSVGWSTVWSSVS
jgi:hypothetical protein